MAETRKCEAPKVLWEPEKCGRPFPARGVKKTCSPGCARKLKLARRRKDNEKKAAERPLLTCRTPDCEEKFPAYKGSKYCRKHRRNYNQPHHKQKRNTRAVEKYWKDSVLARAKNNAKAKATRAKDPEKYRAKKRVRNKKDYWKDPEKSRAKGRGRYWKDVKKSRAKGRGNYAKNKDKIDARQKAAYWKDPVLARAKNKAKTESRKLRHPRRFRALARARDARRRAKAAW
jgi:hypothetical protein